MINEDDDIYELNQLLYEEAGEHNERIKDSMLVATAYIAVGSKILRSLLDQQNYKKFMDHIAEEEPKPFKKPVLH
jgi:hypothetical protein|tara:strand:+ start:534 stop:758 length:225 start_codon:yes stop_codon:yes gene_type:complete